MTTAQFPEQPAPLFERPPVPAHPSWCVCGHGGCQGGDRSTWTTIADDRGSDGDTTDWPIVDSAGYLPCGCHGSQRDHTCEPAEEREWDQ
jgi:hypothetical protein